MAMSTLPVELEAGSTDEEKGDILQCSALDTTMEEDYPMNASSGVLPALTESEDPHRRFPKITRSFCIGIMLRVVFTAFLIHTIPSLLDPAWNRLFHGSAARSSSSWEDAKYNPTIATEHHEVLTEIPQFVLDYAPFVHLYSEEKFWPCDIAEHLLHTTPDLNYTPIEDEQQVSNLTNLDELNEYENGRHVFLTSNDNVEDRPDWLGGQKNIPNEFSENICDEVRCHSKLMQAPIGRRSQGGRSDAPAVLVTVNKGDGVVDAFWFFFYSYNLGNVVLNVRFGNHVGDWEHTLVRFHHGKPVAVYYSEHDFGSAYSYDAVEKIGKRPVTYSATGTHAMYATPGAQPYILPLGLLHDQTDRGPLWDPALNVLTYTYDHLHDTLRASNHTPEAPIEWFYFAGHWGDKFYPLDDKRQYGVVGEYHYVNGPLGPRFKHLGRRKVCQGSYTDPCVIKHWLGVNEVHESPGVGEGEDWPEDPELLPLEMSR